MKNNKKIIIALFFSFIMLIGAFAVMTSGNSNNITLPVNNIPATANRTNPVNYYIELSGVPSGTGFYQQLITINNPADYGINSNGSNILFFDNSNLTELYAWEQSVNSSAIQVWIKNYNSSSVIDMEVLASSDNEFSANGYLGESNAYSSNYNNFKNVFASNEYYLNYTQYNQHIDNTNYFIGYLNLSRAVDWGKDYDVQIANTTGNNTNYEPYQFL